MPPTAPQPPGILASLDPKLAKRQIVVELHNCQRRGLLKSAKWLSELNYSLKNVEMDIQMSMDYSALLFDQQEFYDTYLLCKSFFDNQEYQRCAYFAEQYTGTCSILRFLRYYALFLDYEKKRLESMCELTVVSDPDQLDNLTDLLFEIVGSYEPTVRIEDYDSYDLYLLGMISRRTGNTTKAVDYLLASLKANCGLWGGWIELSFLVMDRSGLAELESKLPDCWMKFFFLGHIYLELHMNDRALKIYQALRTAGFHNSCYIKTQIAIAYHNVQRVDEAIESFDEVSTEDPFRLDDMDLYSNMLYVKGEKYYLQVLANKAFEIDKYRVETCCIVGNLHSIKREHHKAIEYFERALRVNPYYLSAWTLMGHEFMELKNSNAAIQCYREAVEVNRHDYRAWNGLGQTYDILKMPAYSLYYYKQAHRLRPNDSRLLTALGEAYEKLDRPKSAVMCYERARQLGDIEGLAILKLAKMQKTTDPEKAAKAYLEYLQEMETQNVADRDEQGKAHCFLAHHYYIKADYDASYKHTFKCLEFPEVKDDAKNLLVKLAQARAEPEQPPEGDYVNRRDASTGGSTDSEGEEIKMEISLTESKGDKSGAPSSSTAPP